MGDKLFAVYQKVDRNVKIIRQHFKSIYIRTPFSILIIRQRFPTDVEIHCNPQLCKSFSLADDFEPFHAIHFFHRKFFSNFFIISLDIIVTMCYSLNVTICYILQNTELFCVTHRLVNQ